MKSMIATANMEKFERDGFLAVENVLSPEEVEEAKNELSELVERLRGSKKVMSNAYGEVWRDLDSPLMIQFEHSGQPLNADDPHLELHIRKFHDIVFASRHLSFLAQHPKIEEISRPDSGRRRFVDAKHGARQTTRRRCQTAASGRRLFQSRAA